MPEKPPLNVNPRITAGRSQDPFAGVLIYVFSLLMVISLAAGCTSAPVSEEKQAQQKPLIWPSPPDPARITYERSISSPDDLGAKKGIFKKMLELVLGAEQRGMIKPYGVTADSQGRLLVVDTAYKRVHIYDLRNKKYAYIDSAGKERFAAPIGVATDAEDNIYVTDSMTRKVYVYNKKGKFLFDIDGGKRPTGIAVNKKEGILYVVDTGSHRVRILDLKGKEIKTFGAWGDENGQFDYPVDIFVDDRGEVYVTDTMNYRIQIFNKDGRFLSRFGHHGDGAGDFGRPKGVAVDSEGNVYVADAIFDTVQIFSRSGELLLNFGGLGSERGEFWMPGGIFVDDGDNIYIADTYNKRVQVFEYLGGGS